MRCWYWIPSLSVRLCLCLSLSFCLSLSLSLSLSHTHTDTTYSPPFHFTHKPLSLSVDSLKYLLVFEKTEYI